MGIDTKHKLQQLELVNIYCDESRFSNPYEQYFLIGSLSFPRDQKRHLAERLGASRTKHGFLPEMKWQNVTEAKLPYLNELLQIFFTSTMEFRCIIVDKSKLQLGKSTELDELSFYKFYYFLLKGSFTSDMGYYIFIDERTKANPRSLGQLQQFLQKALSEEKPASFLNQLQEVRSDQSIFIQFLDLLMGAVGYYWNGFRGSQAKVKFVNNLARRLEKPDLKFSSQRYDKKWNQFVWEPTYTAPTRL